MLVSDEVLDAFSVTGHVDEIATERQRRFAGVVDRFSLYTPYSLDEGARSEIIDGLRG